MENWRSFSSEEKSIIRKMLDLVSLSVPDLSEYQAQTIDEYGSISMRPRRHSDIDSSQKMKPIVTARFDDEQNGDPFAPCVNLIIFGNDAFLSELQIYRVDGTPMNRPIIPDELVLLTGDANP